MSALIRNKLADIAVALALTLIPIALWLPFGLRITGLVEEWDLMSLGDQGVNLFWITSPEPHLSEYRIRPLLGGFFAVARLIDPDSFIGVNLLLIALIAGKGVLLYAIMRRLILGNRTLALMAATLAILYPGAQGLTPRAFGIHTVIFFYLLALYCLIRAWQSARPWPAMIGALLALTIAVNIYETIDPLIGLAPLLLIWLEGRISRRVLLFSAFWLAVPLLLALRVYWVATSASETYHAAMLHADNFDPANVPTILGRLYRDFVLSWADAVHRVLFALRFRRLALIIAAGYAAVQIVLLRATDAEARPILFRRHLALILIALAMVGAGFLIYSAFIAQRSRTALYCPLSGLGASMVLALILHAIPQSWRIRAPIIVAVSSGLIALAAMDALWQHDRYVALARAQQQILRGIVDAAPGVTEGTCFVVIDEGGTTRFTDVFLEPRDLGTAASVVYGDPSLRGFVCHPTLDCSMDAVRIIGAQEGEAMACDRFYTLTFRYDEFGHLHLIDSPAARLTTSGIPHRAASMLEVAASVPREAVRLEFDGAELIHGRGWYEPEVTVDGITHRWMKDATATINLRLVEGRHYHLKFRVVFEISQLIHESLRMEINNRPVTLTRTTLEPIYEADFEPTTISPQTTIALTVDQVISPAALGLSDDSRAVGLALDWLEITPR